MMRQVTQNLELAELNWQIAEAYLKDAEESLHVAVEGLEHCLTLMAELNQGESISDYMPDSDNGKPELDIQTSNVQD